MLTPKYLKCQNKRYNIYWIEIPPRQMQGRDFIFTAAPPFLHFVATFYPIVSF